MNSATMSVRDAAKYLGVHENTVRNWVKAGVLRAIRLPNSRFHRFEQRELDRVRGRTDRDTSAVAQALNTVGPELVDGTQLHLWAITRSAQEALPELIRRLLASAPGITNLSIRAGDGVALEGWDGHATSSGTSFLPDGELFFEFSTGKNPAAKADENYEKRKADPLEAVPANSIFVFITPRRWRDKMKWARTRREERFFADVQVLDADDLEAWLQSAPAVHHWISERLGRRPEDAQTLSNWWSAFQSATLPPMPASLFVAGRSAEADRLTAFLSGDPQAVAVRAPWKEDVLAFLHAAIAAGGAALTDRVPLVIRSATVWSRAVPHPGHMILLAAFDSPDIQTAVRHGHHVILVSDATHAVRNPSIELPPLHRAKAAEILQAADIQFDRAYRLAALARRSMPALVRELAKSPRFARPAWSLSADDRAILAPLALLGSWTTSEYDCDIVSKFTQQPWPTIERVLNRWRNTDDPPLVLSGNEWRLASPREALLLLHDSLTTDDLRRWKTLCTEVLLELNPKLELPPYAQPIASLLGAKRKASSVLRKGLAQAVAAVGSLEDARLPDGLAADDHARTTVRSLLQAASNDDTGQTWRSLSDVLPALAEASPTAFLYDVHSDLDRASPLLAGMFQDRTQGFDGFFASSAHTGLLWALETLAWSPDWILDACRALARLHRNDPGGRLSNRPLESLANILVGWILQTSAPLARRKEVLKAICGDTPDVGWSLLLELWPEERRIATPPVRPRFRDWFPDTQRIRASEQYDFVRHVVGLAVELAANCPDRYSELAKRMDALPAAERERVIEFLDHIEPASLDAGQRVDLWEALNSSVIHHQRNAEAPWSLKGEALSRLQALATCVEPGDVGRYGHLFDWHPDISDVDVHDHHAYEERLRTLQREAVSKALAAGGIGAIEKLAAHAPQPNTLGWIVAEVSSDRDRATLLDWLASDNDKLNELARGWVGQRARAAGTPWVRTTLQQPTLSPAARRTIALLSPPGRELWDTLADLDRDLLHEYWTHVGPWHISESDTAVAATAFLEHDRPWNAISLLGHKVPSDRRPGVDIQSDLVEKALDAASRDLANAKSSSHSYEVGKLIDYLEACRAAQDKLVKYEFGFFDLLQHEREPRALFEVLAADPRLFVWFVELVYRGKNEAPRDLTEGQEEFGRRAWSVLHDWNRIPGLLEDGSVDSGHLAGWVRDARLALSEKDRTEIGDEQIGQILAASPPGSDGVWPAEAVRDIVEAIGSISIERGIYIGERNKRGMTSRGPYDGGEQERELVARYNSWAKATESKWRRTTRILRELADAYERDARDEDDDATKSADSD